MKYSITGFLIMCLYAVGVVCWVLSVLALCGLIEKHDSVLALGLLPLVALGFISILAGEILAMVRDMANNSFDAILMAERGAKASERSAMQIEWIVESHYRATNAPVNAGADEPSPDPQKEVASESPVHNERLSRAAEIAASGATAVASLGHRFWRKAFPERQVFECSNCGARLEFPMTFRRGIDPASCPSCAEPLVFEERTS